MAVKSKGVVAALLTIGAVLASGLLLRVDSTASGEPGALETALMRRLRRWLTPEQLIRTPNPAANDAATLRRARLHYADHCAFCHGADGAGGQFHFYPPAPDLRQGTQQLSDGEIYFAIASGIRFSGMPAFGDGSANDLESWELVRLIRALPQLSPQELQEIAERSPQGVRLLRERREEEEFLHAP